MASFGDGGGFGGSHGGGYDGYSVAEVRAVLADVTEQLGFAYRQARSAQARLTDALDVLNGLGQHHEPLVPAELRAADSELARGLELISGGVTVVAAIDARL